MSAIHYKAPLCRTITVCGQPMNKLSVSYTEKPTLVTCARCQKHADVKRAHADLIKRVETKPVPSTKVLISFEIEPAAAYELAQFCKRLTFSHFRECAVSEENAYQMINSHELLYAALREAGFNPR